MLHRSPSHSSSPQPRRRLLVAAAVVGLIFSNAMATMAWAQCSTDDECIPASCCHPSTCVWASAANVPNCTGVACTLQCVPGTLDCGQGRCECQAGVCQANIFNWTAPGETSGLSDTAVPTEPVITPPDSSVTEPPTSISECGGGEDGDDECVPAQCCHATSCVRRSMAPNCSTVLCSMVCMPGTLDCGQGHCECDGGACVAVMHSTETSEVATTPDGEASTTTLPALTTNPEENQTDPTAFSTTQAPSTTRANFAPSRASAAWAFAAATAVALCGVFLC